MKRGLDALKPEVLSEVFVLRYRKFKFFLCITLALHRRTKVGDSQKIGDLF